MNAAKRGTSRGNLWLVIAVVVMAPQSLAVRLAMAAPEPPPAAKPAAPAEGRRLRVQVMPADENVRVFAIPERGDGAAEGRLKATESGPMRLGVALTEIPDAVRAQINNRDLPAGFGVMVQQVEPGSPAEQAGLEPFDILVKFDDQKLVSGQQLVALVNAIEGSRPAAVTLLRQGRRKVVKVRLTGNERGQTDGKQADTPPQKAGDAAKEHMVIPGIPNLPPQVQELLKQLPQNGFQVFGNEGFPMQATVTVQGSTVMATDNGTITITDSNGNRTVTIQDRAGKQVFAGPLNSAEEWEQVPEPFRAQLPKP